MSKFLIASVILVTFVTFAVFGLFMPTASHMGHDMDCPFAPGGTALCAAPIAHLKHWQDAFVSVLFESLLVVGIALVCILSLNLFPKRDPQYERYRLRARTPIRPLLFQELYSRGILNRKEPSILNAACY